MDIKNLIKSKHRSIWVKDMKKKILIGILVLFSVISLGMIILFMRLCVIGSSDYLDDISMKKIILDNSQIILEGEIIGTSALGYSTYSYRIEDETIYIKLYFALKGSSTFHQEINGDFKRVKNVYLRNGKGDERLIYSK